ncbi:MAG: spore coat protein U domain-containing protein [Myxococcales bacterium]|nr:spore coat protein U domain-containing protein [Myxococcales bacterium]
MTTHGTRSLLVFLVTLGFATFLAPTGVRAATCGFNSVSTLAFGAYDVFAVADLDSVGTISYTCTAVVPGDTVRIDLNVGTGGPSYTPRQLQSGIHRMDFNIYLDAARTAIWGDGSSSTSFYTRTNPPDGTPVLVNTYGRIPAGQSIPVGAYSSTITVTMSF